MEPPTTKAAQAGSQEHAALSLGKGDDYLRMTMEREKQQFVSNQPYEARREAELYLRDEHGTPYFLGHPDQLIIAFDDAALVQDVKTGPDCDMDYWRDQLENYAALMAHNYRTRFPILGQVISKFHGVIRFSFEMDEVISKTEKIKAFALGILPNELTPGPWCRYCNARLICDNAEKDFSHPLALSDMPRGEPGARVVEKLKLLIALAKERVDWYEAQVTQDPKFLDGIYEMSKGKELGEITDAQAAIKVLGDSVLHTDSLQVSYARIRDHLVKTSGISKKDAKEALKEILGELLVFKTTKGSLRKANEPAPIEIENGSQR